MNAMEDGVVSDRCVGGRVMSYDWVTGREGGEWEVSDRLSCEWVKEWLLRGEGLLVTEGEDWRSKTRRERRVVIDR